METQMIVIVVILVIFIITVIVLTGVFLGKYTKKTENYETFQPKTLLSKNQTDFVDSYKQDYAPGVENVNNEIIPTYQDQIDQSIQPAIQINKQLEASVAVANTNSSLQANTQYDQYQQQQLGGNRIKSNTMRILPGVRDKNTTDRIEMMNLYKFGKELPPEYHKLKETASNTGITINPNFNISSVTGKSYTPSVTDTKGFQLNDETYQNEQLINSL